jgi:tetratricopeptide (TPR) repeat protein
MARNPGYAPGWMRLTEAYLRASVARNNASADERRIARETYTPKAEAAGRRAIELDANSADSHLFLAVLQTGPRRWASGEDLYKKALALDPSHPDVLGFYGNQLLRVGRIKDALVLYQQLRNLEPFVPLYAGNLAQAFWLDGQNEAAIAILKDNLGRPGAGASADLSRIYASLGRYGEAADILSQFPTGSVANLVAEAVPLLRAAPAKAAQPASLPRLGSLGFIYLHVGAPERVLEYYEEGEVVGTEMALLWHPSYAAVRKMERFKAVVREAGLVDYWRERGWPAFCRPIGADDFECT